MKIPHITIEQAKAIYPLDIEDVLEEWLPLLNDRIDRCNAQAEAEQSEHITAEQARALGAGNAEYSHPVMRGDWDLCDDTCGYTIEMYGEFYKYRAIKQPKLVGPHAELKALYAQQIKDGTLDDFIWEYLPDYISDWRNLEGLIPTWHEQYQYRSTPKPTCQVQLIGEPIKTMAREAAKALQAETRDTHDWFDPCGYDWVNPMGFRNTDGPYTYRPKAKKVISWADIPAGVMTNRGELRHVHGDLMWVEQRGEDNFPNLAGFSDSQITLAPAAEQPWLNHRGGECPVPEGVIVEVTLRNGYRSEVPAHQPLGWKHDNGEGDIIEYRVVGITDGYVLGGN